MKRINRVWTERVTDTDPDLSFLGEYSNTPDGKFSIDRQERGDMLRGEYRYFNPSDNYKGEKPSLIKKYTEQDYLRMEAYNRSEWCMLGVIAYAEIATGVTGCMTIQVVQSAGIWGTESDSDESYLNSHDREQLKDLLDILKELGFTAKQFSEAKRKAGKAHPQFRNQD